MLLEGYLSPQTSHATERQHERQPPQALFLAAVSNTTQTPCCVITGYAIGWILVSQNTTCY